MKWNAVVSLEVIFFGICFGQVWGNFCKNPSHPKKFACSYTYASSPSNDLKTSEKFDILRSSHHDSDYYKDNNFSEPCREIFLHSHKARSDVFKFGGENTFLGGHDFCFYHIFETNFSGNKKIWGCTKEILGGTAPRGFGPDSHYISFRKRNSKWDA